MSLNSCDREQSPASVSLGVKTRHSGWKGVVRSVGDTPFFATWKSEKQAAQEETDFTLIIGKH